MKEIKLYIGKIQDRYGNVKGYHLMAQRWGMDMQPRSIFESQSELDINKLYDNLIDLLELQIPVSKDLPDYNGMGPVG